MSVSIDGSAGVTTNVGAVYNGLQTTTAQASTSGTSIDFTSIPLWVKRITVMFSAVSTNGTSNPQIQLGSGSFTTSGYVANATSVSGSTSSSTGFILFTNYAATDSLYGFATFVTLGSFLWTQTGTFYRNTGNNNMSAGGVTLPGTLDRVRITTVAGTDTFDAGLINILYE